MPATPATSQYLQHYITERLPVLEQGALDVPGDPPSITVDQRFVPLRDPAYQK
jgi:hypothetical protein